MKQYVGEVGEETQRRYPKQTRNVRMSFMLLWWCCGWLLSAVCFLIFLLSPFSLQTSKMATIRADKVSSASSNTSLSAYEACKKQLSKAVDWDEKSHFANVNIPYFG